MDLNDFADNEVALQADFDPLEQPAFKTHRCLGEGDLGEIVHLLIDQVRHDPPVRGRFVRECMMGRRSFFAFSGKLI